MTEFQSELQAIYQKAVQFKAEGKLAEAEVCEAQAALILQRLKERAEEAPEDPETAGVLLYLADRQWAILGDHQEVQSLLARALALREKALGARHALTAEALAKLAEFHFLGARFGEAEPLFRKSIAIYESSGALAAPGYPKALQGLAHTLAALGRLEDADPVFERAIECIPKDDQGRRSLYFLLTYRADGLEKLGRAPLGQALRQRAQELLPKNNPGESGFQASQNDKLLDKLKQS